MTESGEPRPAEGESEAIEAGFGGWPSSLEEPALPRPEGQPALRTTEPAPEEPPTPWFPESEADEADEEESPAEATAAPESEEEPVEDEVPEEGPEEAQLLPDEHAAGRLVVPPGYRVLQGQPGGSRRGVGVVVSRFNGQITSLLLASALAELERAGVTADAITVMPVPGAFELPLGAMALAKTRRYACIVALGCVVRGETPHFEYVSSEAASGLQLAALETGIPVAFGVLTTETVEQAQARVDKGAEAVRTALEMADLFSQLRMSAASAG